MRVIVIFSVLVLAYAPTLLATYVVNPDAQLVLPQLQSFAGVLDYFRALLDLKTFDLQPVRDLSLLLDLFAWAHFHVNLAVWQNLFLWSFVGLTVGKIAEEETKVIPAKALTACTLAFMVYPLFVATLPWGMARKHILSTLFTSLATLYWLRSIAHSENRSRNLIVSLLSYGLALGSQPICILWPVWAIYRAWRVQVKQIRLSLGVAFSLLLAATWANQIYYAQSPTFRTYYASKTEDGSILADRILSFGHYIHQLILPYATATSYDLGDASTLLGLAFCLLGGILIWKRAPRNRQTRSWILFLTLPLLVVIVSPRFMSDSYLLIPAVGLFLFLLCALPPESLGSKPTLPVLICLMLLWGGWTFKEARYWTDPVAFADQRNFQRRPSCDSAVKLALKEFPTKGQISEDLRRYLVGGGCLTLGTPTAAHALTALTLKSYMLFTDEQLSPSQKEDILRRYGRSHHFPLVLLALQLYREGRSTDGAKVMQEVFVESSRIQWVDYRDEIIAPLANLCRPAGDNACMSVVEHYLKGADVPWL